MPSRLIFSFQFLRDQHLFPSNEPGRVALVCRIVSLRALIRGALAADDALKRQDLAIRFRVRETPDWKKHAADLESEMLKRGMRFEVIDWSEDQPTG
jgi:hypothetical protein